MAQVKLTMGGVANLDGQGRHEGFYFRSLRPDEDVNKLEAKNPNRRPPRDSKERTEMIQEHIKYGSKLGYESPWLSLTAELDVALAFAGMNPASKTIACTNCIASPSATVVI